MSSIIKKNIIPIFRHYIHVMCHLNESNITFQNKDSKLYSSQKIKTSKTLHHERS